MQGLRLIFARMIYCVSYTDGIKSIVTSISMDNRAYSWLTFIPISIQGQGGGKMEYRRRRRRRRFAAAGGGTYRAIAALLVVAAVVYLISASAAGTWIAQNVMAPAFAAFDNMILGAAEKNTPDTSDQPATPKTSGVSADTVTGDVELPVMECFALQMGVYSDKNNADLEAQALQQRGAGGYVMEDAGRYRVFAAAYDSMESLKQVRDQLTTEGMESASYTFNSPVSTLRVTATQAQLDGISAGFKALSQLEKDIASATLTFDQQKLTAQKGRDTATTLLSQLRSANDAFTVAAEGEDNPVLQATRSCFSKYEEALTALSQYSTESFVDFSAKMKYTHICIAHAYATLAQEVSAMA